MRQANLQIITTTNSHSQEKSCNELKCAKCSGRLLICDIEGQSRNALMTVYFNSNLIMKDLNFIIQNEDDHLDDLSMEDIKGGINAAANACCGSNHACNVNQIVLQPLCPWCPV